MAFDPDKLNCYLAPNADICSGHVAQRGRADFADLVHGPRLAYQEEIDGAIEGVMAGLPPQDAAVFKQMAKHAIRETENGSV